MRTHFCFLRQHVRLQSILQQDGWKLEGHQAQSYYAQHPEVPDEASARSRLDKLGLLTSAWLRIEFGLPGTQDLLRQRRTSNRVALLEPSNLVSYPGVNIPQTDAQIIRSRTSVSRSRQSRVFQCRSGKTEGQKCLGSIDQ